MKYINIVLTTVVAVILSFNADCNRKQKNISTSQEEPVFEDLALQIWAECLFNKSHSNSVTVTKFEENGVITSRIDPTAEISGLKSGFRRDASWIYLGKAGEIRDTGKLYDKMTSIYGDKCFEARAQSIAGTSDKDMYHRACQG